VQMADLCQIEHCGPFGQVLDRVQRCGALQSVAGLDLRGARLGQGGERDDGGGARRVDLDPGKARIGKRVSGAGKSGEVGGMLYLSRVAWS
jgi:hypothetical protein